VQAVPIDGGLRELARLCATTEDRGLLLTDATPLLARIGGERSLLLVLITASGPTVALRTGAPLPEAELPTGLLELPLGPAGALELPPAWVAAGIVRARGRRLPGGDLVAVVAATDETDDDLDEAIELLGGALARLDAEHRLTDLIARVDNAQQLADMGDYDWHIATDTNTWSDQLYRIYGYEPQEFNAGYDRFLSHIHPDDRERIMQIHQQAYATGEPYQMIERIVRPDGEVRYLASNGQVLRDEQGTPIRMRGTCIDVTERVRAEEAHEAQAVTLREAQVRRRQALEVNDNVVQGLSAAVYSMRGGDLAAAADYLDRTLASARRLMNDWLTPLDGSETAPGDLVRERPSTIAAAPPPAADGDAAAAPAARVLVVDDNDDVRHLLRAQIAADGRYEVVGDAADGEQAVDSAQQLQPDIVILDLAMPRMDGLQALPLIRAAVPGVRVIVLSGFDQSIMARRALAAGAARYVEKGLRMDLATVIGEVLAEETVDA
jgi:PAS domain S-box-containing protein